MVWGAGGLSETNEGSHPNPVPLPHGLPWEAHPGQGSNTVLLSTHLQMLMPEHGRGPAGAQQGLSSENF
jgi:hypothetical protein